MLYVFAVLFFLIALNGSLMLGSGLISLLRGIVTDLPRAQRFLDQGADAESWWRERCRAFPDELGLLVSATMGLQLLLALGIGLGLGLLW